MQKCAAPGTGWPSLLRNASLYLAVLLLMDERAGRLEAISRGLALIGSAAVIGLAKTEGLIPAARPLLEQMIASGYFIGSSIVSSVLADVGE